MRRGVFACPNPRSTLTRSHFVRGGLGGLIMRVMSMNHYWVYSTLFKWLEAEKKIKRTEYQERSKNKASNFIFDLEFKETSTRKSFDKVHALIFIFDTIFRVGH